MGHRKLKTRAEPTWLCQCTCGNQITVLRTSLYGRTQSCGCLSREKASQTCSKRNSSQLGISKTRDYKRTINLKRYGITILEYDDILAKQNSLCAICKKRKTGKKALSVDHDHKTGKIRGLLCAACNIGIGMLQDSETLLISAVEYLRAHTG